MPARVQRKRTKGWRMPEGAVYVGRPTKWGNPFPLDGDWITWAAVGLGYSGDTEGRRAACVALYASWLTGSDPRGPLAGDKDGGDLEFSNGHRVSMAEHARGIALAATSLYEPPTLQPRPDATELRGKDLACFCPVGVPCHADVLLEIANRVSSYPETPHTDTP